jgi:hypothetical protein
MANKVDLLSLDACALRERLASGAIRAMELAEAAIARIEAREPEVRAFAWFDPDFVRQQARVLDEHRQAGRPVGALHGLPVALKDIIDTARIPTENGCETDAGRVPVKDAAIVARLKSAGAILMGKTVTTELAYMQAGPTRNPHNPAHTPGGCGGLRDGAAGRRHADRRLGHPARLLLRRDGLQAQFRRDRTQRHPDAIAHARHGRGLCPRPRRCRPSGRGADGP